MTWFRSSRTREQQSLRGPHGDGSSRMGGALGVTGGMKRPARQGKREVMRRGSPRFLLLEGGPAADGQMARQSPGEQAGWPLTAKLDVHRGWLVSHRPAPLGEEIEGGRRAGWSSMTVCMGVRILFNPNWVMEACCRISTAERCQNLGSRHTAQAQIQLCSLPAG